MVQWLNIRADIIVILQPLPWCWKMATPAPGIIYIFKAGIKGKQRRSCSPQSWIEFCLCLTGQKHITWPLLATERLSKWVFCLELGTLLTQAKLGSIARQPTVPAVGQPQASPFPCLPDKQWCLALLHFLLFLHQSICIITFISPMITKEENAHSRALENSGEK